MNKAQRDDFKQSRENWHDTPQANTVKLYEQVWKGLRDAGHHSSAQIVKIAIADLLKAYPVRGA